MFQQIVIIGSGRVASRSLEAVVRILGLPPLAAVEPEAPLTEGLAAACRKYSIPHHRIIRRDELARYFSGLPFRTLVLSAHNVFIFPGNLISDERLEIVNFHNSLLPRHRGRNAPSWALFERDAWAGITWHRVSAGIDEGEILCQRRVQPDWHTTALALTRTCVELGIQALIDLLPGLLSGTAPSFPQDSRVPASFHRSRDIPNNGILDPNWPLAQASAFLRALDFGKLAVFPPPCVRLDGDEFLITAYHLAKNAARSVRRRRDPPAGGGRTLCFQDDDHDLTVSLAPANDLLAVQEPALSPGLLP